MEVEGCLHDGSTFRADQVRVFIIQPTYRQHLHFMPFKNFTTLRNVGMLLEEELAREASAKTGSN